MMEARDVVMMGMRLGKGNKRCMEVGVLSEDGKIIKSMLFKYPNRKYMAGWVYTGMMVDIENGMARNLDRLHCSKEWPHPEDRIKWQAEEECFKAEWESMKMAKAIQPLMSDLDRILSPIRLAYYAGDRGTKKLIEQGVLLSIGKIPAPEELK